MHTIELFSGTASFSKIASARGFNTLTTDIEDQHAPDLVCDIRKLRSGQLAPHPHILWASPPCEGFSVAAIGRNWHRDRSPKSHSAATGIDLVRHTLRLVDELEPDWVFVENPRGMLRKLPRLDHLTRHTVTYCQYGDTRMKPTDIWTNADWWQPRKPCRNGSPCHVAAPRGARTGTQGIKGARDRAVIPPALFEELFDQLPQVQQLAA